MVRGRSPGRRATLAARWCSIRAATTSPLLRTSEAGVTTLTLHKVTAGANNLSVSPDGKYVFIYHDIDGPEQLGPGSDQELTVLEVASGVRPTR